MTGIGDVHIRNAIRQMAEAIYKSHSKLRTISRNRDVRALLAAIRRGKPLALADRRLLAELLSGLLDRSAPSFELADVKAAIIANVKAAKAEARGKKPPVRMEQHYERVAKAWNSSLTCPRRVTPLQVQLWYEKQKHK